MEVKLLTNDYAAEYDKHVTHVIQSWEWGDFRKKIGTPVLRYGIYQNNKLKTVFQITLHKIPLTNKYVGYLPKGPTPDTDLADALESIGRENHCIYIKTEPHITKQQAQDEDMTVDPRFRQSTNEYFTKHNFVIDLTKPMEDIQKGFNEQTRRNVKKAQEYEQTGLLKIAEHTDDKGFETYLKLYFETTKRQKYHGHNPFYHRMAWETMRKNNMARILIASTHNQPLTAWMLYNFNSTLYYPYGGSSPDYPGLRASNLVALRAIELGKKLGLRSFDMWGALGEDAKESHPWFGFHRFKKGYGGKLEEYIGTYDLVIPSPANFLLYPIHNFIDQTPWVKFPALRLAELKRKWIKP